MRPGIHRLLLAAPLLACGPQAPPEEMTPLVDSLHAPLVLTEAALLEMPPTTAPNRFLAGWWPDRRGGGSLRQASVGDRVVLEAVFLDGRERRLNTRLEILEAEPGATFGARVAGIELPSLPLVADAEIPLPAGLPLGRLPIELDLRGARVVVGAAGFGHAWLAGEIALAPDEIVQGGYSAIDFPRRLEEPATLVGRFEPPAEPEPGQRYAVTIETGDGGGETVFEWLPDGRDARRTQELALSLPAGFVRVRLLAQGLGGSARWLAMGITGGGAADAGVRLGTGEGRAGTIYTAASDRYELVWAPDLGLAGDSAPSRDAEYLFDLRRDPERRNNLVGTPSLEADWLRSRLRAWIERVEQP